MIKHALKARQKGLTLLETMISLGILAGVVAAVAQLSDQYAADTKAVVAAQHVRTIGEAAKAYIKDNYSAVVGLATPTTPALITVPTMIATGHLPAGFSATNPLNQSVCVLVLEPTANRLNALVVAEAGTTIDDLTLGQVASTIGAAGGGIYSTATTTIRGAMGGWSTPVGNFANANHLGQRCTGAAGAVQFTAGHPAMALWFEDGDSSSAFLYRDAVPGRPELNRMNTSLDMGGNRVSNLLSVATIGTACGAGVNQGDLARGPGGEVLSCQGTTWQTQGSQFWQDPVANFASLPTCNASTAGQTRIVQNATDGANRPRAYTCYGATWRPLALDDNGNLSVPGNATVTGTATINRLAGNLEVTVTATEGTACSPNGRIARDTNGLLLSCQSGSWRKLSTSQYVTLAVNQAPPSDGSYDLWRNWMPAIGAFMYRNCMITNSASLWVGGCAWTGTAWYGYSPAVWGYPEAAAQIVLFKL